MRYNKGATYFFNYTNEVEPLTRETTYNFNAGPSALPTVVLERAQAQLLDFEGNGMSIMEMSHRGKVYEAVHNAAIERMRKLYNIPEDYEVIFMQGGASLQFSMIPMNFLSEGETAGYVMSGSWSQKALKEAKMQGVAYEVASSKDNQFKNIPMDWNVQDNTRYIHMTSNNTIYGTQFKDIPEVNVPLIADMSSDIMSKPVDVSKFAMIYAGAQKNLGPSGVTVAIIKKDFLATAKTENPTVLQYATHVKNNSLYHTPPTFGIYMLGEVLTWIEEQGGLEAVNKQNEMKAGLIYDVIDGSNGKMHTVLHIVLDEGDQLLESRERKDVASIIRATDDRRQLILVSATVTEAIERVANEWMTDPVRFHVTAEDLPKSGEIVHSFIKAEQRDKLPILRGLANVEGLHALAFMNNVDQVVIKQLQLSDKNVPIGILHGELSKQEREKTLREFRQGKLRILLSTDVAARGLDIDGLTHVIHVDVPREEEQYVHRSGRTGRAGKDGEVLSLLSIREEKDYRRLTKGKKPVHKEWAYGELREKRAARPNSPKSRRRPTKRKKKKG